MILRDRNHLISVRLRKNSPVQSRGPACSRPRLQNWSRGHTFNHNGHVRIMMEARNHVRINLGADLQNEYQRRLPLDIRSFPYHTKSHIFLILWVANHFCYSRKKTRRCRAKNRSAMPIPVKDPVQKTACATNHPCGAPHPAHQTAPQW